MGGQNGDAHKSINVISSPTNIKGTGIWELPICPVPVFFILHLLSMTRRKRNNNWIFGKISTVELTPIDFAIYSPERGLSIEFSAC